MIVYNLQASPEKIIACDFQYDVGTSACRGSVQQAIRKLSNQTSVLLTI